MAGPKTAFPRMSEETTFPPSHTRSLPDFAEPLRERTSSPIRSCDAGCLSSGTGRKRSNSPATARLYAVSRVSSGYRSPDFSKPSTIAYLPLRKWRPDPLDLNAQTFEKEKPSRNVSYPHQVSAFVLQSTPHPLLHVPHLQSIFRMQIRKSDQSAVSIRESPASENWPRRGHQSRLLDRRCQRC